MSRNLTDRVGDIGIQIANAVQPAGATSFFVDLNGPVADTYWIAELISLTFVNPGGGLAVDSVNGGIFIVGNAADAPADVPNTGVAVPDQSNLQLNIGFVNNISSGGAISYFQFTPIQPKILIPYGYKLRGIFANYGAVAVGPGATLTLSALIRRFKNCDKCME